MAKTYITSFSMNGVNLFTGTYGDGVFLSTDVGIHWSVASSGLTDPKVLSLAVCDSNLFAGTGAGVFLSTNIGATWSPFDSGLTNTYVTSLAVSGTSLYAGTFGGVFLSSNGGAVWVNTGLTGELVLSLALSGGILCAGSYGGVSVSTNEGTTWKISYLPGIPVLDVAIKDQNLFAATGGGGIYVCLNNGANWTPINSGLPYALVKSLGVGGTSLFAGTLGGGVWRRPLSEILSVDTQNLEVPRHSLLSQNYPNPFNPSTTIRYELPHTAHVVLRVYNTLGQKVATLVDENKAAGVYWVLFDGSQLASGVYFYRMQAGDYAAARRLLILK